MAQLAIQKLSEKNILANFQATDDTSGDTVTWSSDLILMFNNATGGAVTATIVAQNTTPNTQRFGEVTKADESIVLADGEIRGVAVLPRSAFIDGQGNVNISYSGAGLTVGCFVIS